MDRLRLIIVLIVVASVAAGCARFATSDKKIAALEDKVSIGMTVSEFAHQLPSAQLVKEQNNQKIYVAGVSETCFICGSVKGFQKSFESYATEFVFENDELVSVHRLLDGE